MLTVINLGVGNRSNYFLFVQLIFFFKFAKMETKEIHLYIFNKGETDRKNMGGQVPLQILGRVVGEVQRRTSMNVDHSLLCFVFACAVFIPPPDSLCSF